MGQDSNATDDEMQLDIVFSNSLQKMNLLGLFDAICCETINNRSSRVTSSRPIMTNTKKYA